MKARRRRLHINKKKLNEIVVVVLGDIGRSPRITYQARSFLQHGYYVTMCGYLESEIPSFLYDENVDVKGIKVVKNTKKLPFPVFAAYKASMQILDLISVLSDTITDKTRYVLIQNPPCLPLLAVLSLLKSTTCPHIEIIVDWHNLNYTILNLRFHNLKHPLVRLMKKYEMFFSRKYSDLNFTVTNGMRKFLIDQFKLKADNIITLYDRPASKFSPLKDEKEFNAIVKDTEIFKGIDFNRLTDKIIITSTSFTADEDFHVLTDALIKLDERLSNETSGKVIMIVTGKGPLKNKFLNEIDRHRWIKVTVKDVWLSNENYPRILKIANLGISLHYSSSGLDLPMKIIDLFGAGVPVISMNYPVVHELVKEDINGVCMKDNRDGQEMCDKIHDILFDNPELLGQIKKGAMKESQYKWDDEWNMKLGSRIALEQPHH